MINNEEWVCKHSKLDWVHRRQPASPSACIPRSPVVDVSVLHRVRDDWITLLDGVLR